MPDNKCLSDTTSVVEVDLTDLEISGLAFFEQPIINIQALARGTILKSSDSIIDLANGFPFPIERVHLEIDLSRAIAPSP